MNGGSNMQLILFPLPYEGHMNPMLHLAQILHSKGFSITIIHIQHINSPHPSDYPSFTFRSIPHGLSGSDVTSRGVVEIITLVNDGRCVEPLRKCVAELVAASNIGCLITDAHWHFTHSVADEFQIRRLGISLHFWQWLVFLIFVETASCVLRKIHYPTSHT
ncbi:UDP-glycosyltransferase 76C3, partial [Cucurbita argyrosperma subsp. sororia]